MAYADWTVTTLAQHLRGAINQNPDAPGGTIPTRVTALVIEAGMGLWNANDWRFRRKKGTLYVVQDQSEIYLPNDHAELYQRWLRDQVQTGGALRFTEDVDVFQTLRDEYVNEIGGSTEQTEEPKIALIVQDHARSGGFWKAIVSPTADDSYRYEYWYVVSDPWSRRANLTTSHAGANNDLTFTAVSAGYTATPPTITFTAGAGESVSVAGSDITIQVIAGASTAAWVLAAVRASTAASALVYCDHAQNSSGAGTIPGAVAKATLTGPISDATGPAWPSSFGRGWMLLAQYQIEKEYRQDDRYQDTFRNFKAWMQTQIEENDETISQSNEYIQDGYADHGASLSRAGFPYMTGNLRIAD